jgi:hypothetical protein
MVEENGAAKCSEIALPLSLAADDVFGNYWWYAFNTNVCFRGYVMLYEAPLLLAQRDKLVALNIFDRKYSVDFPTREDWSTE